MTAALSSRRCGYALTRRVPYTNKAVIRCAGNSLGDARCTVRGCLREQVDSADPLIVLEACLIDWRQQTANILEGEVGFGERPFEARYSSMDVRRKVPLTRKSSGTGAAVSSIDSEFKIRERP